MCNTWILHSGNQLIVRSTPFKLYMLIRLPFIRMMRQLPRHKPTFSPVRIGIYEIITLLYLNIKTLLFEIILYKSHLNTSLKSQHEQAILLCQMYNWYSNIAEPRMSCYSCFTAKDAPAGLATAQYKLNTFYFIHSHTVLLLPVGIIYLIR